jgi:dienelactone hydrolase
MNQPYIYESDKNQELANSTKAIVMLPDVYCQTEYAKQTVGELAEESHKPVFLLDYFYIGTNQANNFAESDRDQVHQLMDSLRGDQFVVFFQKAITEIQQSYPNLKQFVVVGFCFGGRLAYLTSINKQVIFIVSFYGAGTHLAGFVDGKSPIEYLVSKRGGGKDLQVTSFFGTQDESIPEADRTQTQSDLVNAGIYYRGYDYDAGHAYFQEGRPNYNEPAATASWKVLRDIII